MNQAKQLALPVKLLLLDVDGVLTDGRVTYDSNGQELKSFHIQDGLGIKLLQRSGIQVGIVTGRSSSMVDRRAQELGIDLLLQGREDKWVAASGIIDRLGLAPSELAYMGDDLPDLKAIIHAGLGIAPADATPAVRQHANLLTQRNGGHGAVREACEFILNAQGKLDDALNTFLVGDT